MNAISEITHQEFTILGHCLGIHPYSAKLSRKKKDKKLPEEFYRNYFCAGEKHSDLPILLTLQNKGFVEQREGTWYFHVTELGEFKFRQEFKKYIAE